MRAGSPSENMKTRMVTVSGGTLSYHDVGHITCSRLNRIRTDLSRTASS